MSFSDAEVERYARHLVLREIGGPGQQKLRVKPHPVWLDAANARAVVAGYDLVLDGTDDFATRFAVSDACLAEGKTLVSGALGRWTGQVGVFQGQPCYRCLVPEIPPDAETCALVGVVGALAGVIGSMMALEAVKLITGAGHALAGRLLIYDALAAETRTVRIGADPTCPSCGG
jgi:molybdopterin/thiamine biosynthesis adenylyltransferase